VLYTVFGDTVFGDTRHLMVVVMVILL